jgi:hypothetical protein
MENCLVQSVTSNIKIAVAASRDTEWMMFPVDDVPAIFYVFQDYPYERVVEDGREYFLIEISPEMDGMLKNLTEDAVRLRAAIPGSMALTFQMSLPLDPIPAPDGD